jgi:hypothetical protein
MAEAQLPAQVRYQVELGNERAICANLVGKPRIKQGQFFCKARLSKLALQ